MIRDIYNHVSQKNRDCIKHNSSLPLMRMISQFSTYSAIKAYPQSAQLNRCFQLFHARIIIVRALLDIIRGSMQSRIVKIGLV